MSLPSCHHLLLPCNLAPILPRVKNLAIVLRPRHTFCSFLHCRSIYSIPRHTFGSLLRQQRECLLSCRARSTCQSSCRFLSHCRRKYVVSNSPLKSLASSFQLVAAPMVWWMWTWSHKLFDSIEVNSQGYHETEQIRSVSIRLLEANWCHQSRLIHNSRRIVQEWYL